MWMIFLFKMCKICIFFSILEHYKWADVVAFIAGSLISLLVMIEKAKVWLQNINVILCSFFSIIFFCFISIQNFFLNTLFK